MGTNLTPVNAETFSEWKRSRKERDAELESENLKKKSEEYKRYKAGMKTGMTFSGRELFDFNPEWANAVEEDGAMEKYLVESDHEVDTSQQVPIKLDVFQGEDLDGLDD